MISPSLGRKPCWLCSAIFSVRGGQVRTRIDAIRRQVERHGYRWKYGEKLEAAERSWQEKASEIQAGKQSSMLSILENRGLLNQIAGDRVFLDKLMTSKRIGAYVGIDPTARSLHVGHLLPLMALLWMYVHGFTAVTLLGGATAKFGDPTGRLTTRKEVHSTERRMNLASMHMQLTKMWKNMERYADSRHGYKRSWAWKRAVSNNSYWMNKLSIVEFLRVLGKGARVGTMLGRDTARTKMENGDGLSFAEFTYPLLQAWDWFHLYETLDVQVQIGGADQFGNIIAGLDALKYITKDRYDPKLNPEKCGELAAPVGFTVPLMTSASGEKFGKSEGNAIWLDPEMCSPFDQYQFFLRSSDEDVGQYLRRLTLIPTSEIDKLLEAHSEDPSKRAAQHMLAGEVLEMIHGPIIADQARGEHGMLFGKAHKGPQPPKGPAHGAHPEDQNVITNKFATPINSTSQIPHHLTLPRSLVKGQSIPRVLHLAGLVDSRSEGNRLIDAGGAYIGGQMGKNPEIVDHMSFVPIQKHELFDWEKFIVDDSLLILRVGKWKMKIVRIMDDDEFEKSGISLPQKEESERASGGNSARKAVTSTERHFGTEKPTQAKKQFPERTRGREVKDQQVKMATARFPAGESKRGSAPARGV